MKDCHVPEIALGGWVVTPSPVYSLPVSPCFGAGLGGPGAARLCRRLTHDLAGVGGPVAAPERDGGLRHHRQMLLYSQELEEDYTPCEEDLFVL